MSRDVVPWQPRRLSRAQLREWLRERGPQPFEALLLQARLQVAEITEEELEEELVEHPALFQALGSGRWASAPERPRIVIFPSRRPVKRKKPTPPPVTKTAGAKRRPAASPRGRATQSPPSTDPFFVEDGRLVSVIFRRDVDAVGQPYESGGHLLLPVPQDADVSDAVRDAIAAACRDADQVQVYERAAHGELIFRGQRQLLEASLTADGTRMQLVFAPDPSDEGRVRALNTSVVHLLGSGMTRALVVAAPREQIAEAEKIPPALQKIAALSPARRKADRVSALRRARELLLAARADGASWGVFRDWLIRKKPEYDRELLETILKLALDSGCEGVGVFHLARLILGDREPLSQGFARSFCIALAATHNADALAWASVLLPAASLDEDSGHELQLAAARIHLGRGDYKEACEAFSRVVADPTTRDDADWIAEFLLAAIEANDRRAMKRALKEIDAALVRCKSQSEMARYRDAMGFAIDIDEILNNARPLDRIEQLLQLLVAIDEPAALKECKIRTAGEEVKTSERLRLLSVMEDCEHPDVVTQVWVWLSGAAQDAMRQARADLIEEAIEQLMFLEEAVGDTGHSESSELRKQLAARQARVGKAATASTRRPRIQGKNILLVGGRAATRSHASQELLRLGANEVREIPPSWEQHVDESVVRAKARGADIVATLTDFMKHDASVIVGILHKAGFGFRPVRTAGGPSRIVRDILAAV